MEDLDPHMAQRLALAASDLLYERAGHKPISVDVILSGEILLITMYGALSQAEKALAQSPEGAARFQEFHRRSFTDFAGQLRQEVKRVTDVSLREVTANGDPTSGAMVQVFTSGTVVLVFLLAQCAPKAKADDPLAFRASSHRIPLAWSRRDVESGSAQKLRSRRRMTR